MLRYQMMANGEPLVHWTMRKSVTWLNDGKQQWNHKQWTTMTSPSSHVPSSCSQPADTMDSKSSLASSRYRGDSSPYLVFFFIHCAHHPHDTTSSPILYTYTLHPISCNGSYVKYNMLKFAATYNNRFNRLMFTRRWAYVWLCKERHNWG